MVNKWSLVCRLFVDKASTTHVRHVSFVDFGRFLSTFFRPKLTKIDHKSTTKWQFVDMKYTKIDIKQTRVVLAPCVVLMSVWCCLSTWCRPILVDFCRLMVDFGWFWSIFVDVLSTSCRHKNLCRHEVERCRFMSSTKIDMSLTKMDIRSTYNRQKTTKIMSFDVDIISTQKSVSISCRHEISQFLLFFVDCMLIWCPFWSNSCRFLSISCRWHVSNMRSTNYPYFINWCQFLVVFFGRHQNDINFDVDFMSTTHNFFFWKFFSFLTHVDKVWTLRKIYIFTMKSKRYWFSSHNIRKDTIGMTQSVHSNKTR